MKMLKALSDSPKKKVSRSCTNPPEFVSSHANEFTCTRAFFKLLAILTRILYYQIGLAAVAIIVIYGATRGGKAKRSGSENNRPGGRVSNLQTKQINT